MTRDEILKDVESITGMMTSQIKTFLEEFYIALYVRLENKTKEQDTSINNAIRSMERGIRMLNDRMDRLDRLQRSMLASSAGLGQRLESAEGEAK